MAPSAREFAKLIVEISLRSWKHARGMVHSVREFVKLVFECSVGNWTHARGMPPSACEFAKLIFEISVHGCAMIKKPYWPAEILRFLKVGSDLKS